MVSIKISNEIYYIFLVSIKLLMKYITFFFYVLKILPIEHILIQTSHISCSQ